MKATEGDMRWQWVSISMQPLRPFRYDDRCSLPFDQTEISEKGSKRVVQLIGETPLFCGTIWGPFPFWGGCITCSTAITARRDTTNHQLITDMYICRCCERWTSLPHKRSFHQHGQLVRIWMSRSECAAAVCGDMRFRFRVYTPFAEPAPACCGFSLSVCWNKLPVHIFAYLFSDGVLGCVCSFESAQWSGCDIDAAKLTCVSKANGVVFSYCVSLCKAVNSKTILGILK